MSSTDFRTKASRYLASIISQRIRLDADGRSKNPTAGQDAAELRKYLDAYPDRTNSQMASFWIKNQDKIQNIIPGTRSGSSSALSETFDQLTKEANYIFRRRIIPPNSTFYGYHNYYEIR